jgi:hypothetical protein
MLALEGIVVDEKVRGNVERKCVLRAKILQSVQLFSISWVVASSFYLSCLE